MRRSSLPLLALTLSLFSVPDIASASSLPQSQSKPDPKPEQKPAPPTTISGKWAMTLEMPTGMATPSLELVQNGEKISGSYQGRYGKFPVTGSLKKNALVFTFTMSAEGQDVVMTFTGEVAADLLSMKGTADMPGLGEAAWSAKRAEK